MSDDPRPPATGYPVQSYALRQHRPSIAAVYPYPQPQHQQQNPYFYNNNNNNNYLYNQGQPQRAYYDDQRRASFICHVIFGMVCMLIIIGFIFYITLIIFHPKSPHFTIDSATVSGFNISGDAVSGAWDFRVTALNLNKRVKIVYENFEFYLGYKSCSIADKTLAPFSPGNRDLTTIRVSFAVNDTLASYAAGDLDADRSTDGVVSFTVAIYYRVLFDAGIWRVRRRVLFVLCPNIVMSIPNGGSGSGNMIGGAKGCSRAD